MIDATSISNFCILHTTSFNLNSELFHAELDLFSNTVYCDKIILFNVNSAVFLLSKVYWFYRLNISCYFKPIINNTLTVGPFPIFKEVFELVV